MEVHRYYHYALLCRKWHLSPIRGKIKLDEGNRLSSLKKLYVACQTSIQKMILISFRSLVISHVTIRKSYTSMYNRGKFTAASFMQQNDLNMVEW